MIELALTQDTLEIGPYAQLRLPHSKIAMLTTILAVDKGSYPLKRRTSQARVRMAKDSYSKSHQESVSSRMVQRRNDLPTGIAYQIRNPGGSE